MVSVVSQARFAVVCRPGLRPYRLQRRSRTPPAVSFDPPAAVSRFFS